MVMSIFKKEYIFILICLPITGFSMPAYEVDYGEPVPPSYSLNQINTVPDDFKNVIQTYHKLIKQKQEIILKAERLNHRSIQAARLGNKEEALRLLEEAIFILKKNDGENITPVPKNSGNNHSYEKRSKVDLSLPNESNNNSPFAIQAPFHIGKTTEFNTDYLAGSIIDLNAKNIRIISPEIDKIPETIKYLADNGILMYTDMGPEKGKDLEKLVTNNSFIKYWRVGNEPDGPLGYARNPLEYLRILKDSYSTIKSVSPNFIVSIGGLAGGTRLSRSSPAYKFLETLLENGGGEYFDIFAFHFQGDKSEYRDLAKSIIIYRNLLKEYGYNKPIWITEMATYDGNPAREKYRPIPYQKQSEMEQASTLVKLYVTGISNGAEKLFWSFLVEPHNFGNQENSYFDNVGLIHNPCNDNNYDDNRCNGDKHKKLAYYAFQLMSKTLEGSDWNSVEIVSEKSGNYIYKFSSRLSKENPVWVAWSDNENSSNTVYIDVDGAKSVTIISSVPLRDNINQVPQSTTEKRTLYGKKLKLELTNIPIYVSPAN